MMLLRKLAVLGSAILLSACAATRPPLPEVKLPPEKILQKGYSLMPLNEPGWLIGGRNNYSVAFGKLGANQDETFAIQAMFSRLPTYDTNADFLQLIKGGQAKDSGLPRFEILKQDVTSFPMKGTDCAESHMITVDHAPKRRSGNAGDMILESLTLSCAHPSEKAVAIHVAYSHRHDSGQKDPTFMEKGRAVLNSVELFEPDQPYISEAEKANMALAAKFSASCSKVISHRRSQENVASHEEKIGALAKLSSMGILVERDSVNSEIGIYALFEKDTDGRYTFSTIQLSYVEPTDIKNQELLFVSPGLDRIAPAYAKSRFNANKQAFVCESGTKLVTGIDSSYRAHYNPCDSSLTTSGEFGSAVVANTALTVLSLGTNLLTGSSVYFVDTDKDKVAKLAIDSGFLLCLEEADRSGLKAEIANHVAMVPEDIEKKEREDAMAELEKLGGSECAGSEPGSTAESYYQRGNVLMGMSEYKKAMICFLMAQTNKPSQNVYRDSCSQIAMMYELGWGVDKDIEKSKSWLNKANLQKN